ncbi:MAG: hypothetical protein J7L96_10640 [Bacteroidales bacterium]|nr:hypothetical protein [Bacteroidales bacterium]
MGDKKLTTNVLKDQDFQKIYQFDQVINVGFLGDFLYLTILVGGEKYPSPVDVFFDIKKNEGFTIDHQLACGKNQIQSANKSRNLENNLFGLEQLSLFMSFPQQNLRVNPINVDLVFHFSDINCIKNLDVKYPEIRDRLVRIIEEPKEEDGNFIVPDASILNAKQIFRLAPYHQKQRNSYFISPIISTGLSS